MSFCLIINLAEISEPAVYICDKNEVAVTQHMCTIIVELPNID